jgi:membrane-associated phospholipid phosphatase
MIFTAGLIQLLVPAESPLPANMNGVQLWFHRYLFDDLYVCFPSMHVALTVFVACIGATYFRRVGPRAVLCLVVTLIFLSTITLKEHYVVDSVAGALFALIFFMFYYFHPGKYVRRHMGLDNRSVSSLGGNMNDGVQA